MRNQFIAASVTILILNLLFYFYAPLLLVNLLFFGPVILCGIYDCLQKKHTILRNFPVLGHFRYWLELIRPEINQYFIESNTDGVPISREQRSLVYQRAKKVTDTLPFGTQRNVYETGYEWVNHSICPIKYDGRNFKVLIGAEQCKQPYNASIFNIGSMSYGALSRTAIEALNAGAKLGDFAHATGEGGVSPYHKAPGGDLIWQIGTGYFGCRAENDGFDLVKFKTTASLSQIKMIELKLSQGAKPGKGGLLPVEKIDKEVSEIRGISMGKDCISPSGHSAFSTPIELLEFLQKMREASGGKPVGFKICLGKRREFISICKAMIKTGLRPDFITIDGGEGGTGAAPVEFSNYVGFPLKEGLIFAHNVLLGFGLRDKIKIIASGGVITGFDLIRRIALGADACYGARSMMLALGCIQALRCNTNECPTGVATQNPKFYKGLVVSDKKIRVANYHRETIKSVGEILGAMALKDPSELRPWHIMRRTDFNKIQHYGEIYDYIKANDFLNSKIPADYQRAFKAAHAESFRTDHY